MGLRPLDYPPGFGKWYSVLGQRGGWPLNGSVVLVPCWLAAGIGAAQRAAVQWAGGGAPGVELAGVVWVADSPRRLPRSLRGRRALVSGAFPTSVAVPWVGAWREGDAWASPAPISAKDRKSVV